MINVFSHLFQNYADLEHKSIFPRLTTMEPQHRRDKGNNEPNKK